MIQRIQTIYLLCFITVIAVFLITDCRMSEGTGMLNGIKSGFQINSQKTVFLSEKNSLTYNWEIIISLSACAILTLIAIFTFRNLKLQKKLLSVNYLLIATSCFLVFLTHYNVVNSFKNITELNCSYCLFLPFFLLFLFNFLSIRGIAKDIELLASADRLR